MTTDAPQFPLRFQAKQYEANMVDFCWLTICTITNAEQLAVSERAFARAGIEFRSEPVQPEDCTHD